MFAAVFLPGVISLKFPETPTVKAASLFFVSRYELIVFPALAPPVQYSSLQAELLPRWKDVPLLAEVLQADGKLLTETVLQVILTSTNRDTRRG